MEQNKKYIVISGLLLNDNNRGTAALGYGVFPFLCSKGLLSERNIIIKFKYVKNILKKQNRSIKTEKINIGGNNYNLMTVNVFFLEKWLLDKLNILLPFTRFKRTIKNIAYIAAINGGDGFSDIYNTQTFLSRLKEIRIAMKRNIPLIMLPQTIGPFEHLKNRKIADKILRYADKIFVRDNKFVSELEKMGLEYEQTKDLSAYMKPEPWNINIKPNSIGINVSGLAYSNSFRTLSGQFDAYPELIDRLILHIRDKGHTVYLIPHSYHYGIPEPDNDDMVACRTAYERLTDKSNVVFIDKDLISPQVKYVISKMSFFIGTRMHANFAAIYSRVPLFGLAYSYKFEGAFTANGLNGKRLTAMINNISKDDIDKIIKKIDKAYTNFKNENTKK